MEPPLGCVLCRRPDENHFLAAKRILERQLKINENGVNIDGKSVQIVEEAKDSKTYKGLQTVYKKRIISVHSSALQRTWSGVARIND
eukprot:613003-Amphidinium_carterae.1